jgi:hypothetical protein
LFTGDGIQKLFYLERTPLQELKRIIVGTDTLSFSEYCYDLESGWISLAEAPASGVTVTFEAIVSWDLDMGITNWDQNIGNYLFYNTSNPVYADAGKIYPEGFVLYQNYPNPFNPTTKIKFTIPQDDRRETINVTLKVYDVLGNEIATLVNEELPSGKYEVEFGSHSGEVRNLTSGIYFYQLLVSALQSKDGKAGSFIQTKKMLMIK